MPPSLLSLGILTVAAFFLFSCERKTPSDFYILRADRTISKTSAYPRAIDLQKVGSYTPETRSGAGVFYDEVLEYRVWLHPEKGAKLLNGGSDYFVAFAQYEMAQTFAENSEGAEEPLVLVRQIQSINEPKPGQYIHDRNERITEWKVSWLAGSKREVGSIEEFLKHPKPLKE